jgi:hypothetical protein
MAVNLECRRRKEENGDGKKEKLGGGHMKALIRLL